RDLRGELAGVPSADGVRQVATDRPDSCSASPDEQTLAPLGQLEGEIRDQAAQCRVVVEGHALLLGQDADGAVHGARVHAAEAEAAGESRAGARLARACRTVDGHHRLGHRGVTSAPSSASRVKNPGKETSTHSGSRISTPPSATSPATANAIATR